MLFVATLSLGLASCGDDNEPDDPDTGMKTEYGKVTATGVKTFTLFISASDGDTKLNIPGFAPIRAIGRYNVYTKVTDNIDLYSDDDADDFSAWTPGSALPTDWVKETHESYKRSFLVRIKAKNSDEYVYAYLEKVRSIVAGTGNMKDNKIGEVFKYTSPIDPLTFEGFTE